MIAFTIPYPPTKAGKSAFCRAYSLNAYMGRKHWTGRSKDTEDLHTLTRICMKQSGIRKNILDYPVEIRFYWDDGMDVDNHAALGKTIVDAMKSYLIENDNPRHFRKVSHEFWNGGCIRVEIVKARSCENGKR